MTLLPPVGWSDVATEHDLTALCHELRADIADVRIEIHETAKTTTLTIVGAIAALSNVFRAATKVEVSRVT